MLFFKQKMAPSIYKVKENPCKQKQEDSPT